MSGHTSGLNLRGHQESFGPLGTGAYEIVPTSLITPGYIFSGEIVGAACAQDHALAVTLTPQTSAPSGIAPQVAYRMLRAALIYSVKTRWQAGATPPPVAGELEGKPQICQMPGPCQTLLDILLWRFIIPLAVEPVTIA